MEQPDWLDRVCWEWQRLREEHCIGGNQVRVENSLVLWVSGGPFVEPPVVLSEVHEREWESPEACARGTLAGILGSQLARLEARLEAIGYQRRALFRCPEYRAAPEDETEAWRAYANALVWLENREPPTGGT